MAVDIIKTLDIIETMENFLSKNRPQENIRDQRDLSYKIEGQSLK